MRKQIITGGAMSALLAFGLVPWGHAAVVTFATPNGATTGGGNVNATAIFTTGTNSIEVVLQNFQADPTSVTQAISAVQFTLSTHQTSATILSSSGIDRDIASDGTWVDGATATSRTHWGVGSLSGGINLDDLLGPGQADELIIGPPLTSTDPAKNNRYYDANGSIKGNGPHNPFTTGLSADFVLSVPGVTAATTVTTATFQFGTTEGSDHVNGTALPNVGTSTPEPASMAIFAVSGVGLLRRRRTKP